MRSEERKIILSVAAAIVCTAVFLIGGFLGGYFVAVEQAQRGVGPAAQPPEGVDMTPVWKAWQALNEKFVPASVSTSTPMATTTAELNQEKVWGMIGGLAASLNDPYTFFMPPSEREQFATEVQGSFEGVGMEIDVKDGILTVVSPLKSSPAERAGIRAGDLILKIDGESTEGMDTTAAVRKIRGEKGTKVILTVRGEDDADSRDISVTRDVINVPIITTEQRSDGIFVIEVAEFTANAPDLFRKALREFIESGDQRLIIDLRGNPGGYLEGAVEISSWFLPSGAIVVSEDYAGHASNIHHRSYGYDVFTDKLQMIILVNKGSASASEIMAGRSRTMGSCLTTRWR
ncbi:MAG: Carboxy-processing protease [Candidatus Giovannonibacteria bacterium GW2011_GWA2_53_7]|uniref:Carboxy-processing protease n=1 Tax=Candidatus Giovannonibacteria bacterium GW2011_GWA2_53_7 TaxID=1618650 RepID=A0A0G1XYJ1_9BACT|nr:MAG: Carboxy-processing protease [Candidatus Giovannonibacteria bacterium GW2011_GWA2_53_7]